MRKYMKRSNTPDYIHKHSAVCAKIYRVVIIMNEKKKNPLIKILLKVLSVALAVLFTVSVLGSVAVSGVRHFFLDGGFENTVNETDLNEVKFMANGKTYTASEYVYEAVNEFMPSLVSDYTGVFGQTVTNNIIKGVLSSDKINIIVKNTMLDCARYYLESDSKEAKKRLKNNESADSTQNYEGVKTAEEAAKIYIRSVVLNAVENTTGVNSDKIIVLLSENTRNLLAAAAVISAVMLIICNLSTVFDLLIYFGGASAVFGIAIKAIQSKFEKMQPDKTLLAYKMLKPLADSFSSNAAAGIIFGILLIASFFALFIFYKSKGKTQENNT